MSSSVRLYKYMWIERELNAKEIKEVCGAMVHNIPYEGRVKESQLVEPIHEDKIHILKIPDEPIVKMTKKKFADSFFDEGMLQLGTFHYYNKFDHQEIGDELEGQVVLIGKTSKLTIAGRFGGGYSNYMFSTFAGNPDKNTLQKFEYDSAFVIRDPKGFSGAIQKTLNAKSFEYAKCRYSTHKAIIGDVGSDFNHTKLSSKSYKLIKSAKHYIKPDTYSSQREFRFLWDMGSEVVDAMVIKCPEATKYCERLK